MEKTIRSKINPGSEIMARTLNQKLTEAGYQMLGQQNETEELILSLLKTKDTRYLKAIPFLIYTHNPDLDKIIAKTKHKDLFAEIVGITKKIFNEERIRKELPSIYQKNKKTNFNYEEFKQEFELQKRRQEKPSLWLDKEKFHAERNLHLWLSYIFTRKEREIIEKIINEKQLTKTEYEYYSRRAKKKLNAIIHLQELGRAVVPLSPRMEGK